MFWFAGDLRRMGDLLALRMDGSSPLPEGELGSERIGVRDGEVTSRCDDLGNLSLGKLINESNED